MCEVMNSVIAVLLSKNISEGELLLYLYDLIESKEFHIIEKMIQEDSVTLSTIRGQLLSNFEKMQELTIEISGKKPSVQQLDT